MATVALSCSDDRTQALSTIVSEVVGMAEPQLVTAGRMSGLDIRYDLGEGHPLLGRRMPDLEIETAEGQERLYTHLREARPVLLNLDCRGSVDAGRWSDYIRTVEASYGGTWNLPVTGAVSAPSALLIRPDGYVAWVGQGTHAGLVEALTAWFGRR